MKRLTIPCDFGGVSAPFHVYLGQPTAGIPPLFFQAAWLSKARGGTVPASVLESMERLAAIAVERGMPFEDLAVYALGLAAESDGSDSR